MTEGWRSEPGTPKQRSEKNLCHSWDHRFSFCRFGCCFSFGFPSFPLFTTKNSRLLDFKPQCLLDVLLFGQQQVHFGPSTIGCFMMSPPIVVFLRQPKGIAFVSRNLLPPLTPTARGGKRGKGVGEHVSLKRIDGSSSKGLEPNLWSKQLVND